MTPAAFPTLGLEAKFADETAVLDRLVSEAAIGAQTRQRITDRAVALVRRIRGEAKPTLMEHFLAEYGLSTREGVALMCLAEAMLRVPDNGEGAITVTGGSSAGAGVWAYTAVSGAAAPMAVSTATALRVWTEEDRNRVAARNNVSAMTPTPCRGSSLSPTNRSHSRLLERCRLGKQDVSRRRGILFHG